MGAKKIMGVNVRVVSVLLTSILLLLVGIALYSARGIYTSDKTSYVKVDEIYDDSAGAFDADNVNTLLRYITGDANITYETAMDTLNEMTSTSNDNHATTSADIRSKSVTVNGVTKSSSQDVIVRFGGLDWQVVYLSKTTPESGEDIILTLWLSSSKQDAWADRSADEGLYYGFIDGSLYSDWSANWESVMTSSYPSNMYGTSYIRAVTLNNGGQYATSYSALSSAYAQNENSVFARFTMEEVEGSLTQYITTPGKVSWQVYQSAADIMPYSTDYYFSNDSIEDPADKSLEGKWSNSSYNYKDKNGYKDWANDYLWLPSIGEVGLNSTYIGLWEASRKQCQNYSSYEDDNGKVGTDNSDTPFSFNDSWLRSGRLDTAHSIYSLTPSGNENSNYIVYVSSAVRPALHLNLNAVLEDIVANLPYVKVDEIYDDEAGKMSEENVNVLLKYITGQADVNVDNASEVLEGLASAPKSSEDFRANAVSATGANKQAGQEIKITFGGLDWWATYLSTDTDGNVILTLWLDESQQDVWADRPADEGELYGFLNGSLYSDWSDDFYSYATEVNYPSNMYGTSYLRAVTLNNGGTYATSTCKIYDGWS